MMDRNTFFSEVWRKMARKGFSLVEDSTIVKELEKMGEDPKPARKQQRLPGAVSEQTFLERCTGCDKCMIACPVNVVMIEDVEKRLPIIYPEESPCQHCEGYPCIAACPTGALSMNEEKNTREIK